MAIRISITEREYKWAAYAGVLRQEDAIRNGHRPKYGATRSMEIEEVGVVGEFVASLAMGVSWRGPGEYNGEDIQGFQVRATRLPKGKLLIRPADKNEDRFILVTGSKSPLVWWVHDWIYAREGKQDIFREGPQGRPSAYFVDQIFLKMLRDLRK